MKVAITCDQIIKRGHIHEMVEILLGQYPEAEIFTLAHVQGKVLGPIESRPIHSSFLSNLVKSIDDLNKYSFLIPSACNKLKISCSFDLVIDMSSGFSHAINFCQKSIRKTFIYDWSIPKNGFIAKMFMSANQNFCQRKLQDLKYIALSSASLKEELGLPHAKVLRPCFNASEFPFVSECREFLPGKKDFIAVNADINLNLAKEISQKLKASDLSFIFFGADKHLLKLKKKIGEEYFFGEKCDGELAPFLAGALATVDFSSDLFPLNSLKSLALGRAVFVVDNLRSRAHFKNKGVSFISPKLQFEDSLKSTPIDQGFREQALRFPPLKFKSEISAFIAS